MNIDFTNNDDQTALIEVTVEPQDYKEDFESEIKSYQKKVNLKGFRKGKTPKSMIRKMYGSSVLTEIVTKKLQDALFEYLDSEKVDVLGQPIPSEDQEPLDFKVGEDLSYSFKFDLGLVPDFELAGIDDSYHYYDAVISDEVIDQQIDTLRRRGGTRESVESDFEEDDLISFNAREMEAGEVKDNGLETTFEVMVSMMEDEFKEKVLAAKVGDAIEFDIFKVEKDMSDEKVRKYLMNLDEEEADQEVNPEFRGEIVDATRLIKADLDEEFLTTAFGEEVKTEEEAREFIKKDLKQYLDEQADSLLFQEVHDKLMEETEIDMPDAFLKRWMLHNQNEDGSEPMTAEDIEQRYDDQFRESLRWQLISDKILKKYEVTVEKEEILEELGRRIQQYMPGQQLNQEVYNQILQSLANDEKQVQDAHGQIRTTKMFKALKVDLNLDKEEISQDDFEAKLKDIAEARQREAEASQASQDDLEIGEEE
ncbi:trigger factor [Membranicola marinus]|uniref:Trigger factor n=1 Tax=Membranihabitans marinus TaxID=1227546 RepID=A0A953LAF7_9BACT|nr:trigger factor [Membranihabitans marinus]MBY5959895.1 trigger factor [Membranihabitans marinus]